MSQPYLGEIRFWTANFAPADWAFCDGSLLAISENDALFTLVGTTYGGDGESTFALPDLRGRAMISQGNGGGYSYVMGQIGGQERVTLSVNEIPPHGIVTSSGASTSRAPREALAVGGSYAPLANANAAQKPVGKTVPHGNMAPFVTVNFIICLYGIYPSST
jgi:microcystin-dependent protein